MTRHWALYGSPVLPTRCGLKQDELPEGDVKAMFIELTDCEDCLEEMGYRG